MKIFEFEAKEILKEYGIPVPEGYVASNPDEAGVIAEKIGKPVVLKSQVLVSGRGKAGGILFANNAPNISINRTITVINNETNKRFFSTCL